MRARVPWQFLDIMKEFKAQSIDTPGVIGRVLDLFFGNCELILGFNTFLVRPTRPKRRSARRPARRPAARPLPPKATSYWWHADRAPLTPPTVWCALVPSRSQPPGYKIIFSEDGRSPMARWRMVGRVIGPLMLAWRRAAERAYAPGGVGFDACHQEFTALAGRDPGTVLLEYPPGMTGPQPQGFARMNAAHAAAAVQAQVQQPVPLSVPHGAAGVGLVGYDRMGGGQPMDPAPPGPPAVPANKKAPIEFDQAINYVTKIKTRFAKQPETYKAFLGILHTYQKEQKTIKEVYEQVSHLFKSHAELLSEFSQFLPEGSAASIAEPAFAPENFEAPQQPASFTAPPALPPPKGTFAAWLDAIRAEGAEDYQDEDYHPNVIEPTHVQTAVRTCLPGELAKHAVSEGTKAYTCVARLAPSSLEPAPNPPRLPVSLLSDSATPPHRS